MGEPNQSGAGSSRRWALGLVLLLLAALAAALLTRDWLRRPAPEPQPQRRVVRSLAHFESLEGGVDFKPVRTLEWSAAQQGKDLRRQDKVRTGADGLADIRFFQGARLQLKAESLITIEEGGEEPTTRRRRVAWRISQGEASFKTASREMSIISTPKGTARTGGRADIAIQVGTAGDVELRVFEGSTELITQGNRSVRLTSGEVVRVDPTGTVEPKRRLLDAPGLVSPPKEALVSYPDPNRGETQLDWEPVASAVSNRVTLAADPAFVAPLVDRAGLRETSFVVRQLGLGEHRWRVAAVDEAGVEGRPSEAWPLTVGVSGGTGYGPVPPLSITDLKLQSGILRLTGITEPGATLTVNGIPIDVDQDGRFGEFLLAQIVDPVSRVIVVQSTSINGGVSELSRPVRTAF